jgi:hypothetical protein
MAQMTYLGPSDTFDMGPASLVDYCMGILSLPRGCMYGGKFEDISPNGFEYWSVAAWPDVGPCPKGSDD